MKFHSRQLKQTVDIQQRSVVTGAAGAFKESWVTIASGIPAKVESLRGKDGYAGEREIATLGLTVSLRYSSAWTIRPSTHRFVFEGRLLEVLAVTNSMERDRWLTCPVREIVGERP